MTLNQREDARVLAEAEISAEEAPVSDDTTTLFSAQRLLDEHHATVFGYAYRLTGNATAAEDVAQEVFIRAFRNLHQLRDEKAMRGWLLVITRNEFARWCSKFAPMPTVEMDEIREARAEESCDAFDRAEWVQQALAELPSEFRLVVSMFYFEQMSYADIAQTLSIPIGTVMSRMNRGRAHLKSSLNALAEPKRAAQRRN